MKVLIVLLLNSILEWGFLYSLDNILEFLGLNPTTVSLVCPAMTETKLSQI